MESWKIPAFILKWLKENLDGYQYLTPAAQQLKHEMEKNPLETEEDHLQFEQAYARFLSMLEDNPFTGKTRDGRKAEILANDFPFLFFPTQQGVSLPIGLYAEIGMTDEQDARLLRERMNQAAARWEREEEKEIQELQEGTEFMQEDEELSLLIRKTPSFPAYVVCQVLVLLLSLGCVIGDLYLFRRKNDRILQTPLSLEGLAFLSILLVSVLYVAVSVVWIVHEKKRNRLVRAWGELTRETQEKSGKALGFRDPQKLRAMIERLGTQSAEKGRNLNKVRRDSSFRCEKESGMEREAFQKPQNRSLFRTARPVHVFALLMVSLCLMILAGDALPGPLRTLYVFASEKTEEAVVLAESVLKNSGEQEDAKGSVDLQLTVKKEGAAGRLEPQEENGVTSYQQGEVLAMAGCSREEDGRIYYQIREEQYDTPLYIKGEELSISARNQLPVIESSISCADGDEKDSSALDALFDGSPYTAVIFQKGDKIRLAFPETVRISGMYILNGCAGDEEALSRLQADAKDEEKDAGVRLVRASDQDGNSYEFLLDKKLDPGGYAVDFGNTAISTLEIELVSTTDGSGQCGIAELLFAE